MKKIMLSLFLLMLTTGPAWAEETITVEMRLVDEKGIGESIGTISAAQSPYGVILTPDLKGLKPGIHGFHLHQNPDCSPKEQNGKTVAAQAAGGHYDPAKTGRHEGPYGKGHLGDLPALFVTQDGKATYPVLAPRLKLSHIKGRSVMIHEGGDNHADHPEKLGGGGARIACGVVSR